MSGQVAGLALREALVSPVKGTSDWLPADYTRLAGLEAVMLERFALAGYEQLNTPVLEPVDLHERKSGAGIVSKLFEISGHASARVCLRPELTAGIVRAFTIAEPCPSLPWRVSHAGPAFRRESSARADRLQNSHRVGVERLGDSGPLADAEVIWLAFSALAEAGVNDARIRLGHLGLTLEILGRSGLPPNAQTALVEMLSEASAEGGDVGSLGRGLDHFTEWLRQGAEAEEIALPIAGDDGGIDRLFRMLVPVITGRRSGDEIVQRLRRKWDHGHSWLEAVDRVRDQVGALAELRGPSGVVLDRLSSDFETLAPDSVASIRSLLKALEQHGVAGDQVELDLGFGRGIGFYSQMIFEILAPTPNGLIEVCGGGRYDGLARVLGSDCDDRGVGFAFGLERLDGLLSARNAHAMRKPRPTILVVPTSADFWQSAVLAAGAIRSKGTRAILESGWRGQAMDERARAVGASRILTVDSPSGPWHWTLLDHGQEKAAPANLEQLRAFADRGDGELPR